MPTTFTKLFYVTYLLAQGTAPGTDTMSGYIRRRESQTALLIWTFFCFPFVFLCPCSSLLSGAAGPIPALCVLPTWAEPSVSASVGSVVAGGGSGIKSGAAGLYSLGFHDIGMMAMSSWKNTFIVGIYPEV